MPPVPRLAALAGLVLSAALTACEFPTDAPRWQTKWQVPAESASLSVKSFLPANIALNAGNTAFVVSVPAPGAINTTLGAICGASCAASATIPIPAFNNNGSPIAGAFSVPATVNSVTVTGGAIDVAVTNGFTFDPIRPPGTVAVGSVRIKLTAGAGAFTVADTTISGTTSPMTAGALSTYRIQLKPGAYPAGTWNYQVTVSCPGSTTTAFISPAQSFSVNPAVVAPGITVSKATVVVTNQAVSDSSAAFDLSNTKFSSNALQQVGVVLAINNPFQVSSAYSLTLSAPGVAPVTKALTIPPAANDSTPTASSSTIVFTPAEFSPFLGHAGVRLKYSGTINGGGAGNTVGVRPSHVLGIQASVLAGVLVGNVP
ncbi:MAG: hypothetical protein HY275_17560 [Gemmatimonadetes bacterium]|nr:hypothetical protein [Gemmatimonadota bacterium]